MRKNNSNHFRILLHIIIITLFSSSLVCSSQISYSQNILSLPTPKTIITISENYNPAVTKGITIDINNPLNFEFIIHPGDEVLSKEILKAEATKLIKYFLTALTVPEDELWVNLSPYEKNRIIPKGLGLTEMGRDLLAQDYMLKQLTASLIHPENKLGSKFWDNVYSRAFEKYGTTDIPMRTFNKVWIIPDHATIYENNTSIFIVKSHLKVMLEEDYVALYANKKNAKNGLGNIKNDDLTEISAISSEVIRKVIIPELEREINKGKTFANLRQITNSVILATWYKQNVSKGLLNHIYINKNKTKGIDTLDKQITQKIYAKYVETFKTGVYNYIKEEYDPKTQNIIPKKYFSGGVLTDWRGKAKKGAIDAQFERDISSSLRINISLDGSTEEDNAMISRMAANFSTIEDSNLQRISLQGDIFSYDPQRSAIGKPLEFHNMLADSSNLTRWQMLKWFIKHPTDLVRGSIPRSSRLSKASKNIRSRIKTLIDDDTTLRKSVLEKLKQQNNNFFIPFALDNVQKPWTILGRSVQKKITLSDGSEWSLVFKGAGTGTNAKVPMSLLPSRMDYEVSPKDDGKVKNPEITWVLLKGESYHTAKNEIANAFGIRAAYSMFNEEAKTQIPIALFQVDQLPIELPNGELTFVNVEDYFLKVYENLTNSADILRFLRYLRIDMEDFLAQSQQKDIDRVLWKKNMTEADMIIRVLLKTWRPVIYSYLVQGDVTKRIQTRDFDVDSKDIMTRTNYAISKNTILTEKGLTSQQLNEPGVKYALAKNLANKLSNIAYYHNLGGDVGVRETTTSPKDVTIDGAILDLHSNMLPGSRGFLDLFLLKFLKTRWNLSNARVTLTMYSEALELNETDKIKIIEHFNEQYKEKLKKKPTKNGSFKSQWAKQKDESTDDYAIATKDLGGIDLNPKNLNLKSTGNGIKFNMTLNSEALKNINIQGFSPIINNISTIKNPQILLSK